MQIVWMILISVAAIAVVSWIASRHSADAYWEAYDAAQRRDLEYARKHPDCTYEEAHRERDRVMRRFGRY